MNGPLHLVPTEAPVVEPSAEPELERTPRPPRRVPAPKTPRVPRDPAAPATRLSVLDVPSDRRYLGLKELADYSGLSVRTLRSRLAHRVRPLPHFRLEGKVLVRVAEFDRWLEQFRRPGRGQDPINDAVDAILEGLEVRA